MFYQSDITEPFVLRDGHLDVPAGPGLGVTPLPGRLAEVTSSVEWIGLAAPSLPSGRPSSASRPTSVAILRLSYPRFRDSTLLSCLPWTR